MIIRRPINLATVDPARPIADVPVNRGTVAWWMSLGFNDGGPTYYDLTGRYHGAMPGAPSTGTGIVRKPASRANGYGELSYDFTSQQAVTLPDMTAEFGEQEATIACWLRLRTATPDGAFGGGGLFNFGATDNAKQISFPFSDGNVYISTFDVGRPIEGVAAPPNLTSWNHLVLSSAAGAGNYKMYWNGTPYVSRDRTAFQLPTAPSLGADFVNFWFDGWMDDVRLLNRAWSDSEVAEAYYDSLAQYPTQLRRTPRYFGLAAGGGGGGGTAAQFEPEGDEMAYMGDFGVGQIIVLAPPTAGALSSGAATVYRDGSATKSTAGVTVTASVDGKAGFNTVTVDTGADPTFYLDGHDYKVVFTGGTVGGNSVVGQVVGSFSIRNRPAPVKSPPFITVGIRSGV